MTSQKTKHTLGFTAFAATLLVAFVAWADSPDKAFQAAQKVANGITPHVWGFYILGGMTLAGAIMTITRRNPVVAAICLVGTLVTTAGLYLLLHATFMAVIQMLVYAGAIMVLFVLVVMAVDRPDEEKRLSRSFFTKCLGVVAWVVLCYRLITVLFGPEVPKASLTVDPSFGTVEHIGRLLFSNYLFPFEAISILLLVAIVGAVVVTRRKEVSKPSASSTE